MTEIVYAGRSNKTARRLVASQATNANWFEAITNVKICVGGLELSIENEKITLDGDLISFRLGLEAIEPGDYRALVTIFDPENTQGKAAGSFGVKVIPWGC